MLTAVCAEVLGGFTNLAPDQAWTEWRSRATITQRAKCMSRRTTITTKRPSVEETADLVGMSRRRALELVSIVEKWVAPDSRPARLAGRKNGKQGSAAGKAGKRAGESAPSKNSLS